MPDDQGSDERALANIEIELLKLDRYLEMFGRRSDLYSRIDRAGYLLLRTLDDGGWSSINALSDALGLHASTVSRQVTRLEANGLVSRRVNLEDQRSTLLRLNAAGRRAMRSLERERHRRLDSLLAEWSRPERESLGSVLTRLNGAIANSPYAMQNPTLPRG